MSVLQGKVADMSVFGRGRHTGSLSRQEYVKRRKAFDAGEIPDLVDYKPLNEALAALDEGKV